MILGERFVRKDVGRDPETAGLGCSGQRFEIDDSSPAHQHKDSARLDQFKFAFTQETLIF
jgi:hypothetical protein